MLANIKAPKNGYAYVYVSNESDEMVYFDNLQVSQNRGRIIEENHYYAYGLKIAAISSRRIADVNEGHIDNNHFYNDKELFEDADLNWYDYGFRSYDPQIGRFIQLDPLTDGYPVLTPYQYASNDPITNIDIDGLEGGSAVGTFTYNIAKSSNSFVAPTFAAASTTGKGLSAAAKMSARLALIAARGTADALLNANTIGTYDFFGGNHLDEYENVEEQKAYLQGRLTGDGIAIGQGITEVEGGGSAAATGLATGPGAIVISGGGAVVALHGAGVGAVATADIAWTLKKLYSIGVTASATTSTPVNPKNIPKNGETPSTQIGKDAHKKYNPGKNYTVDRKSNTLENNKVPDAIDLDNKIIRELKPNNPRKIREGVSQAKKYIEQLKKQVKTKGTWRYAIDTYDVKSDGTYIYHYGTLNY